MKKTKRKNITLIEIIIVMFFITIITGIIAYNIKGALDEGKAFRTLEGMKQLENILSIEMANGNITPEEMTGDDWQEMVKGHPLVKNWRTLVKDGWGIDYQVEFNEESYEIKIVSDRFEKYKESNPKTMFSDKKDE